MAVKLDCIIRNGVVATASETFQADIGIANGKIAEIGYPLPEGIREIDAKDHIVAPGALDVHTHFNHYVKYVGTTNADDFESGSRAAAAGGVTTIVDFVFQNKGESLHSALEHELKLAEGKAHIDYGFHITITDMGVSGLLEEISPLAEEGFTSLKVFTTIPHYHVNDRDILSILQAAADHGLMVNVHAEDQALITHLTECHLSQGKKSVAYLPRCRPPMAEALSTWRVATYARLLKCPVYFVHLSCREALDAVRRVRSEGAEIYVEVRPVYLFLDESRYELPGLEGNKYVCLPPLRNIENQRALWEGLRNGEIQTYATDHAPWQSKQKMDPDKAFPNIPAGVANVQTCIGMLYAEGVKKGRISLNQFVAVTSTNPAKLFGLWPRKGTLSIGADADIILIDPERKVKIKSEAMESNADYDPYDGYEGVGWPVLTMSRGEIIYEGGKVRSKAGRGQLLRRSRYQPL
jgi:dihydropyrimidinase